MDIGKVKKAQLQLQIDLDLFLLILGKPVPLVDADDQGSACADDVAEEAQILL